MRTWVNDRTGAGFEPGGGRRNGGMRLGWVGGFLVWVVWVGVVVGAPVHPAQLSGGATTVFDTSRDAYSLPAANIGAGHRTAFLVGKSFFEENWVAAPSSVPSRDGLGPLFNARSCSACHFKDGRSGPPKAGEALGVMLLRVSVPGKGPHGGVVPDPVYGGQIQGRANLGVKPEADVLVHYREVEGEYGDGERYSLRHPIYSIENAGYGSFAKDLLVSPRVAPAMIGMGLLEAIPEPVLVGWADEGDSDGDGISGRLNRVWDMTERRMRIGRFGWKSEQPSVLQQVATAFVEDMGITSSLHPFENDHERGEKDLTCEEAEVEERELDLSDEILEQVVLYSALLAVPARREVDAPLVVRGEELFERLGCAACHVPEVKTGDHKTLGEVSGQTIRPYTDLLLHDMGEELSDRRPSFDAEANEWRTPPLWGLGLLEKVNEHMNLLHDGRARGIEESILWHGGEGEKSREAFRNLPRADREAVVRFLRSL